MGGNYGDLSMHVSVCILAGMGEEGCRNEDILLAIKRIMMYTGDICIYTHVWLGRYTNTYITE